MTKEEANEHGGTYLPDEGQRTAHPPAARAMRRSRNSPEKILARLVPGENGCLIWPGTKHRLGYGKTKIAHKDVFVHRIVFEHVRGAVGEGLVLDHICRNRLCANPDHLEPVTAQENILRGEGLPAQNARKTHCRRGHAFEGDNVRLDSKGSRECCECKRIAWRKRRELHRDVWLEQHRAQAQRARDRAKERSRGC